MGHLTQLPWLVYTTLMSVVRLTRDINPCGLHYSACVTGSTCCCANEQTTPCVTTLYCIRMHCAVAALLLQHAAACHECTYACRVGYTQILCTC